MSNDYFSGYKSVADKQLMEAVEVSNLDGIKNALANGADVDVKQGRGFTALMAAAQRSSPECVEFLIEVGANVNATYRDGGFTFTALSYVVESMGEGSDKSIKLLMDAGANTDSLDKKTKARVENIASGTAVGSSKRKTKSSFKLGLGY